MALSDEDKDRVRVDYLEWSGGYGPDESEEEMEVWLQYNLPEDMDLDEVEAFLIEWKAELEAVSARAFEEAQANPVVWEGTVDECQVRIRRLDEHCLIVERKEHSWDVPSQTDKDGWVATSDMMASHAYERAYLDTLGDRGLPRVVPGPAAGR